MSNEVRERGAWLQVRVSEGEKARLTQLADDYGVSMSALVRMMLTHFEEKKPTVSMVFVPKGAPLAANGAAA
jgi:hypothetical protein